MKKTGLTVRGLLCAMGLGLTAAQAGLLSGPTVNPANGHTYYLLEQSAWTDAEAEAIGLGGHLATIGDLNENAWVFGTFGNFGGVSRCLWIGLTDQAQEGTFTWSSGEPFVFSNWQTPGQPDNAGGVVAENYVHLLPPGHYAGGFWNDFQNLTSVSFGDVPQLGNVPMHGVVEVVPEPAVAWLMWPILWVMARRWLARQKVSA